ncbi:hypothetical protein AOQ73_14025 [Bradyrhizobium pachyrhizi]|nr:hypothetical protein AOQ73_14025 [Bradyrhizobium pachyrhizi]MCP1834151.1 hypothetical protein [Bradyrhizobium sp. USDA 4545]MCP1908018.1 hypothetical protein [Bradyrhizobium elkanii]MCP1918897.1 hypothetical protein [Bradyrhizobium sp. USDA 4532]
MHSNDPPMCLALMPRSNSRFDLPRTEIGGDRAKPAEGSAGRPLARRAQWQRALTNLARSLRQRP